MGLFSRGLTVQPALAASMVLEMTSGFTADFNSDSTEKLGQTLQKRPSETSLLEALSEYLKAASAVVITQVAAKDDSLALEFGHLYSWSLFHEVENTEPLEDLFKLMNKQSGETWLGDLADFYAGDEADAGFSAWLKKTGKLYLQDHDYEESGHLIQTALKLTYRLSKAFKVPEKSKDGLMIYLLVVNGLSSINGIFADVRFKL
jgi:hypothetical protein